MSLKCHGSVQPLFESPQYRSGRVFARRRQHRARAKATLWLRGGHATPRGQVTGVSDVRM
eukprot:2107180-Rhodomonas_salina.1